MSKKQFILFFILALMFLGLYFYFGIAQPIVSKNTCAEYAMKTTAKEINTPEQKINSNSSDTWDQETLTKIKTLYSIRYDYCINMRGW